MNKQQLLEHFYSVGLSRIASDVERLLKPSIRLQTRATEDDSIPIGASKLGGLPDLPAGVEWPQCRSMLPDQVLWTEQQRQGGPLCFLLQINLADVAQFSSANVLPSTGMLYFFAALWKDGFPTDGVAPDCWSVLYYDGESSLLRRTPLPPIPEGLRLALDPESALPIGYQIKPCTFEFIEFFALPISAIWRMRLTSQEVDIVGGALYESIYGEGREPFHLLLGNAQEVQDDMRRECVEYLPGNQPHLSKFSAMDYTEQKQAEAEMHKAEETWQLLLQVDTDPSIGLEWQAWGRGYFWIRQEDLAAHNFDKVCLVMQHT